jgi:hypothetical protein
MIRELEHLQHSAAVLNPLECRATSLPNFVIERRVGIKVGNSDDDAIETLVKDSLGNGRGRVDHPIQERGDVAYGAGERTDVVERLANGYDAFARHQAAGRLECGDATHRPRQPNRTADISP